MKQPNEPSPPQQVAYVVQAPTTVRDNNEAIKEAYSVKAATVLGVVHIICGIISFSCEIDVLVWASRGIPGTLGTGIWTSVFFFISGGLAIGGAQSGKKCLVTATMVMAIISAVCAGVLLIMSAIFLSVTGGRAYPYSYSNYHYGSQIYYINKVPSYSLLIAMGATMLIVAIISAALTCKPLCCRSDDQRVVNSQPNQLNNQVNQGYNQPNQVNNQVGQVHYQPNQETQFHYNQPNMVDPPPYQATQVYDQANQANQMNYSQPNYANNQPNQFNNQPNQVQAPPQTGDWKYGLCDCCNPCNLMCFYAFYCTPCAVYDMAEDLEEGSGILHLLLFLLFPPAPFIMLRGKARERNGIQGGFLGDCCTVIWCCGLDFIQTYKEVNPKESLLCGNERIV